MKINDLALVENINILYENKVILYGAGGEGEDINRKLKIDNIPVAYFCDSDTKKHGKVFNGVKIISPGELKSIDNNEDIAIIITVADVKFLYGIIEIIEKLELRTKNVFTAAALDVSRTSNLSRLRITPEYLQLINKTNECVSKYLKQNDTYAYSRLVVLPYILDSVLVYQSRKVGSKTVFNSLLEAGVDCTHIHTIAAHIKKISLNNDVISCLKNCINKKETIKIISLVREPIAKDLSGYFYALTIDYLSKTKFRLIESDESIIDSCIRSMKEKAFLNYKYGALFDWFDDELKEVFDVDVFEYPFDREKGYTIIKKDNIEILLMKLEKLSNLEGVIGEFVGAPNLKLINANEGDKKITRFLYAGVKEKIKIPREIFDFYYENNPRMDHFYSEEEKKAFLKKWEKNIGD